MNDDPRSPCLRIAAVGDLHCHPENAGQVNAALGAVAASHADLLLLAGDLTNHGLPEQAAVLAQACRPLQMPVIAVLGNHDWHSGRRDELVAVLAEGGIRVLDRDWTILEIHGVEVGVVGVKGFVGGFAGCHLPDFGEPLLRDLYRETSGEVQALHDGLREIALCPLRIVLLHYSPTEATIIGEQPGIWPFLGSDRLAAPIAEHEPDLVLHGHAHHGQFEGMIGTVPVYNVSTPVIERDFWLFELDTTTRPALH